MKNKLFNPIISALFAAIICIATFFIQIPIAVTGGYINLGDAFVILAGFFLNPVFAFLSAGIGSALADMLFGYVTYAPATFFIKGIMALLISLIFYKNNHKFSNVKLIIFSAISELIMLGGYLIYEAFVLSYGFAAVAAVPGNILQGVCGISVSFMLLKLISKNIKLKNLLNWRE